MTELVTEAKLEAVSRGLFDMIRALKDQAKLSSDRQYELNTLHIASFENVLNSLKSVSEENVCLQNRVMHLESELKRIGSSSCTSCTNLRESPPHRKANISESTKVEKPVEGSRLKSCTNYASLPESAPQAYTALSNDPCEVLISGIPQLPNMHRSQMAHRLLTFASLSSILSQVVSTRSWKSTVNTTTCHTAVKPLAFVVKFASPLARDIFVNRIKELKYLNSQNVFGTKESMKISAMNLLPKPTFLLLIKARKLYKSLGYAPPVVKRGVVYMRKSSQAPLSAIYSEADLAKFTSA